MNKKIILLVILVLSLTVIFAGCSSASATVQNGDFSKFNKETLTFDSWSTHFDAKNPADIKHKVADNSDQDKGRGSYLSIEANNFGTNYLSQEIKLEKGATYRLSVRIKTNGISGENSSKFRGAWVGFIEDPDFGIKVTKSSNNYWKEHEEYFTSTTSKTLNLVVGIGHDEKGKAKGVAYFDDVTLEKVDPATIPAGTVVGEVKLDTDKYTLEDGSSIAFVAVGAILTALFIALFMYTYRRAMARETLSNKKLLSPIALFIYMLFIAFIVRFLIAIFTNGMVSELKYLSNIVLKFNGTKLADIMATTGSTLPAGMMYLLFIIEAIARGLHISGDGLSLLIRLPFILADLVAVYMIYNMVSKRQKEHTAIVVASLYAILPSIIMASTGWGMAVSLVGCLLIGMFYAMLNKNYIGVSVLFTVSMLFSNLTVLILPLVLAYLVYSFVKYSDSRVKIGVTSLVALVAFYSLCIPFVVKQMGAGKPFYMFTLMFKDLTSATVLTSNVFNMYGLFGFNNVAISKPIDILNYIFVIGLMIALVLIYLKNRDRLNIILMSAFMLIAVSVFSPRASIEAMALGVVLLFVYASIASSRRAYALVGGFSILSFLNMSLIMSTSGFLSNGLNADKVISFAANDPTFIFFSLCAVAMTIYLGWVVIDVCIREREYELPALHGKLKDDFKARIELFRDRIKNRKANKIQSNESNIEEK